MKTRLPQDDERGKGTQDWPHAPPHRLAQAGVFFVTARCLDKQHYFATPERREYLQESLLVLSARYGWDMEAWAVLSNHYHFVAHSPAATLLCPDPAASLLKFLRHLHGHTARHVNRLDAAAGRQVWHNFRETHLTFQPSYLARLNYVHQNAVHHGLVPVADQWEWCSAARFQRAVTPAWWRTIESFKYDQIAIEDGE
ncbi:transposase [soil metagenome]